MFDLADGLTREDYKAWPGEIPLSHLYTIGVGAQRFFEALKDRGEILGSLCPSCKAVLVPGRLFCETCLVECTEWRGVGLHGEVVTWTSVAHDAHGGPLACPKTIGLVRFPGTQGGLVHFLAKTPQRHGEHVTAVVRPAAERTGSLLDIQHFL